MAYNLSMSVLFNIFTSREILKFNEKTWWIFFFTLIEIFSSVFIRNKVTCGGWFFFCFFISAENIIIIFLHLLWIIYRIQSLSVENTTVFKVKCEIFCLIKIKNIIQWRNHETFHLQLIFKWTWIHFFLI